MLIQARLYWLKRGVPNPYRPYAIKSLKACNVLLKKKNKSRCVEGFAEGNAKIFRCKT